MSDDVDFAVLPASVNMNINIERHDFMNRILLTIMLVLFTAMTAFAAEDTADEEAISGQEFLDGCAEGSVPGAPNQYCMRYIFGLVQVVDTFQQADPDPGQRIFCIDPHQVSLQEVTESTTNWLKSVPNRLHEDAYKLVTEALHKNYPCSSTNI
jgi:hypothetical protein